MIVIGKIKCLIWGCYTDRFVMDREVTASKIAGWDLFVSTCPSCGMQRTVKQHHKLTEMGFRP